jgi:hypothetical protein
MEFEKSENTQPEDDMRRDPHDQNVFLLKERIRRMSLVVDHSDKVIIVLKAALDPDTCDTRQDFDRLFYIDRLNELHSQNRALSASLRLRLTLSGEAVSPEKACAALVPYSPSSSILEEANGNPIRLEQLLRAYWGLSHEKTRRQIDSIECSVENSKNQLISLSEEVLQKEQYLKDLRRGASCIFEDLEGKRRLSGGLKSGYERVYNQLREIHQSFGEVSTEPTGMTANIKQLLSENIDLVTKLNASNKQVRLYELKLRGMRLENDRGNTSFNPLSSSTPPVRSFLSILHPTDKPLKSESLSEDTFSSMLDSSPAEIREEYQKMFLDSSISEIDRSERRTSIQRELGSRFFEDWSTGQIMFSLSEAIQMMSSITDFDRVINFFVSVTCKLCDCDRASYWVVDSNVAWTRTVKQRLESDVPTRSVRNFESSSPSSNNSARAVIGTEALEVTKSLEKILYEADVQMTTISVSLGVGLVGDCISSGELVHVADAYADDRFNRAVDLQSGYRTGTVLCFPIKDDGSGRVVAVVQCINKMSVGSTLFTSTDIAVIEVLGHAMKRQIAECRRYKEEVRIVEKRWVLVDLVTELVNRVECPFQFMGIVKRGLGKLFDANDANIVLLYKDFFTRVTLGETRACMHDHIDRFDGGIVDTCCETRAAIHVTTAEEFAHWSPRQSMIDFDFAIDYDGVVRKSVHLVPLCDPTGAVSAVLQWETLFDRTGAEVGDWDEHEGFDSGKKTHCEILASIAKYFELYVERLWPNKFRSNWVRSRHVHRNVHGLKRSKMLWKKAKIYVRRIVRGMSGREQKSSPASTNPHDAELYLESLIKEQAAIDATGVAIGIHTTSLNELQAMSAAEDPYVRNRFQLAPVLEDSVIGGSIDDADSVKDNVE